MSGYNEQSYQALRQKNIHPALSVFFTFLYLVLVFPVAMALFFASWAITIALSVNLIAVWLQRNAFREEWRQLGWFEQQSDLVVYSISLTGTVVGVMLLWLLVKVTPVYFKRQWALLRGIWS